MSMHLLTFLAYPLTTETGHVFAFLPISVFSAVAVPALQGLMSNSVPENAQSALSVIVAFFLFSRWKPS